FAYLGVLIIRTSEAGAEEMNMSFSPKRGASKLAIAVAASIVAIGLGRGTASAALISLPSGSSIDFTSTPAPTGLPTGMQVFSTGPIPYASGDLSGTITTTVF